MTEENTMIPADTVQSILDYGDSVLTEFDIYLSWANGFQNKLANKAMIGVNNEKLS